MIVSFAAARAGVKQCSQRPSQAKVQGEKDSGSCVAGAPFFLSRREGAATRRLVQRQRKSHF